MGNYRYFDNLMVSYLSDELNTEEKAYVLDWINSSEVNRQRFEELKRIWALSAIYNSENSMNIDVEWKRMRQEIEDRDTQSRNEFAGDIVSEMPVVPGSDKRFVVYKFLVYFAVAASILFAVVFSWRLINDNDSVNKQSIAESKKEIQSEYFTVEVRRNTSGMEENIILPDGSVVSLYRNSQISYHKPFTGNRRDIKLIGRAGFKVFKDKSKPFTVFSGDISTRALGTQFTVSAYENDSDITVRLFEGKVVVMSAHTALKKLDKDFYLLPGEELVYNTKSATAKVRSFRKVVAKIDQTEKESVIHEDPSVPALGKERWYMFNNQPLGQVFDQLKEMYQIDIAYSKKEVSGIYFIGTFNVTDSLDAILKQIGDVNSLKITRKGKKILISKQ